MGKHVRYNLDCKDELAKLGRAFSVPERVQIIRLLNGHEYNIADIARILDIPASSANLHVKVLQEADLVRIEEQPGTRGKVKLCSRNIDKIDIRLTETAADISNVVTVEMPIGSYTSCRVAPTCGIASEKAIIGMDDIEQSFFLPERTTAQMLWTARGFVEYIFPNNLLTMPYKCMPRGIQISAELCSEAPGYNEKWKSDITLWINGCECGTWTSPGDFGERFGRNNPPTWVGGRTQYGMLTQWEVNRKGSFVNRNPVPGANVSDLQLMNSPYIIVRIGNKDNAENVGGFNLFGKKFGDYSQDIIMNMVYDDEYNTRKEGEE